jgi:hypothetical protein
VACAAPVKLEVEDELGNLFVIFEKFRGSIVN